MSLPTPSSGSSRTPSSPTPRRSSSSNQIAWSCCQTVGLDTSTNSIPYLASWAEQASLEVLEQTAAITGRLAQRIEDALLAAPAADEADHEPAHHSPASPIAA